MNYTIAQALERIGPEWARLIPAAAKQFNKESHAAEYQAAKDKQDAEVSELATRQGLQDELRFAATYITSGSAPGYRDVSLTLNLRPPGEGLKVFRTTISIAPQDGEKVVTAIIDVHRFAWRRGKPIDIETGECRPTWIDGRISGVE